MISSPSQPTAAQVASPIAPRAGREDDPAPLPGADDEGGERRQGARAEQLAVAGPLELRVLPREVGGHPGAHPLEQVAVAGVGAGGRELALQVIAQGTVVDDL